MNNKNWMSMIAIGFTALVSAACMGDVDRNFGPAAEGGEGNTPSTTGGRAAATGGAPSTAGAPDDITCDDGESRTCGCTDGREGAQECNADRDGWDDCECSGPVPGEGGSGGEGNTPSTTGGSNATGGTDGNDDTCDDGESRACGCTDGRSGAQECNADNDGWEDCECTGPVPGTGGSSSTGGAPSTGGSPPATTGGSDGGTNSCDDVVCSNGRVCVDGSCVNCTNDDQCDSDEECNDSGRCAPKPTGEECEKNADCGADGFNACVQGECIPALRMSIKLHALDIDTGEPSEHVVGHSCDEKDGDDARALDPPSGVNSAGRCNAREECFVRTGDIVIDGHDGYGLVPGGDQGCGELFPYPDGSSLTITYTISASDAERYAFVIMDGWTQQSRVVECNSQPGQPGPDVEVTNSGRTFTCVVSL